MAAAFWRVGVPPNSALPATRTRLPSRLIATLNFSSSTAERGPRSGCASSRRIGAVIE